MSAPSTNGRRGSLVAVGTGIRTVGQMTVEAIAWIRDADKVLYVVGDPVGEALIEELNPDGAESLATLYGEGKPRLQTYEEMVEEGYEARMLPGVSAEDCLFADLGIDPGMQGCQSYEATDFLANNRQIDPTSAVVLWQIGVVGDATFRGRPRAAPAAAGAGDRPLAIASARSCRLARAEGAVLLGPVGLVGR